VREEHESVSPRGFTIFCEDIRNEVDGKHTLVGVVQGRVGFPNYPVILPKFCLYITYSQSTELPRQPVDLRIIFESTEGEETLLISAVIDIEEGFKAAAQIPDNHLIAAQANAILTPLQVGSPGRIKVRGFIDGHPPIRMGGVEFIIAEQGAADPDRIRFEVGDRVALRRPPELR